MTTDPTRFTLYHESLTATVTRTGTIAIVVAFIVSIIHLHHFPATSGEWHPWLTLVVSVAWISFGGHWVELAYLNGIRPRIANWSDASLVFVRLGIWLIGGAILFLCAMTSRSLLMTGEFPGHSKVFWAALIGGPIFCGFEMFPHTFLLLRGRPSFLNLRG